jgi:hypothetical protein
MHGAALAAAQAASLAHDLQHHALHVHALGDAVAVAAMGRADIILVGEIEADPHPAGLLAEIDVGEAGDVAEREFLLHPLLEGADREHPIVGPFQIVAR